MNYAEQNSLLRWLTLNQIGNCPFDQFAVRQNIDGVSVWWSFEG